VGAALLLLADGRFPSGGHTFSAGVESAVAYGDVVDIATLERFLAGRLATTGVVDAAFACRSCAAHARHDADVINELDREYDARVASPRSRTVSRQLGRQLVRAAARVWPDTVQWPSGEHGPHHTIALGAAVAAAGGTPHDAATIATHHMATAVTTAAVRLLGLDPLAVAALQARHVAAAGDWSNVTPRDLPAASGTLSEILAQHHDGWSHRLFVA
jgi:urease accessory protein